MRCPGLYGDLCHAVAEGVVLFGSDDGNLCAVDIQTGRGKWRFDTDDGIKSSPATAHGVVFFGSDPVQEASEAVTDDNGSSMIKHFRYSKSTTWLYRIVANARLMKIRKEMSRAKYLTETGYDDAVAHDWRYYPEKPVMNVEPRDVLQWGLD